MLLSGFTFIRNARKYDFPVLECIESMLPFVDELVVNVGKSEDGTEELIAGIKSPKIKIVNSVWDDSKTEKGLVLSEQTNIALDACQGKWALYLQADEALHESEHEAIRRAVEAADAEEIPVDGLRFRYLHFYAGYTLIQRPWNWYPSEIRVIRRASGARSYGDAQTFRLEGDRELSTKLIDAHVYHYGHARNPENMERKIHYFHRFWHGEAHSIKAGADGPYQLRIKDLTWYWGTHPAAYAARVQDGAQWSPTPQKVAGGAFKKVVIFASKAEWELALQLKTLIEEKMAGAEALIVVGLRAWIKAFVKLTFARRTSAFVDLWAEGRGILEFLIWILDPVTGFRWRVAHAPNGKLSKFRCRFYSAVNWGVHENAESGFRVPASAQLPQLGRWLGISEAEK